jgi:predicted RNase H-like HicB family nuclease
MSKRRETITTLAAYVCKFHLAPAGRYTVTYSALPEIVTYGSTLEEARGNAREPIELVLEAYQEDARNFPASDADPRQSLQEVVTVKLAHI